MQVTGLLLAAGSGRRMGTPKGLLRDQDGTAWVARSSRVLRAGGCGRVVVVLGAAAEQVGPLVPAGFETVLATQWAQGMSASLVAGLRAIAERDRESAVVVVALVDMPGVTSAVVARLVARLVPSSAAGVLARAAYAGVPGHPVLLGRDHWAGVIAQAHGDAGARAYLAGQAVTLIECADVGDGADVDTDDDLAPKAAVTPKVAVRGGSAVRGEPPTLTW